MKRNYQVLFVLFILPIWFARVNCAAAQTVTLGWNASVSSDVVGYNIYYGTNSGSYPNKIDAGEVTTFTISNLTAGVTYYFAATDYDAGGNESGYSSEISFLLPGILTLTQGANAGAPPVIQFPVAPGHWYEVQATTDLQSWASIWQTDVATANTWLQFTDPDSAAFSSRFYRLVLH